MPYTMSHSLTWRALARVKATLTKALARVKK